MLVKLNNKIIDFLITVFHFQKFRVLNCNWFLSRRNGTFAAKWLNSILKRQRSLSFREQTGCSANYTLHELELELLLEIDESVQQSAYELSEKDYLVPFSKRWRAVANSDATLYTYCFLHLHVKACTSIFRLQLHTPRHLPRGLSISYLIIKFPPACS